MELIQSGLNFALVTISHLCKFVRHFDDIFTCIFVNEKLCILIKISLKFVPKGPIYNNPALVSITNWRRRIGDKPSYESMLTRSLTHICGTRGRWHGKPGHDMHFPQFEHVDLHNDCITLTCPAMSWEIWEYVCLFLHVSHIFHDA